MTTVTLIFKEFVSPSVDSLETELKRVILESIELVGEPAKIDIINKITNLVNNENEVKDIKTAYGSLDIDNFIFNTLNSIKFEVRNNSLLINLPDNSNNSHPKLNEIRKVIENVLENYSIEIEQILIEKLNEVKVN